VETVNKVGNKEREKTNVGKRRLANAFLRRDVIPNGRSRQFPLQEKFSRESVKEINKSRGNWGMGRKKQK